LAFGADFGEHWQIHSAARDPLQQRGVGQAVLRDEALGTLKGSELILHAGDVGVPEIIGKLNTMALVELVKRNVDNDPWASALPATGVTDTGSALIFVLTI
jgi:predicted phosphodiesterase